MSTLEILLIALALAVDSFSVAAGVALTHRSPRQIFRLCFHFGLFQALLALLGMTTGKLFFELVKHVDHWAAFVLLSWLGVRMLSDGGRGLRRGEAADLTRGFSLVALSLAVSIDAAAAGVGLAALAAPPAKTILLIGVVSALASLAAFGLSGTLRHKIGAQAERIAGIVLILLGIKILLEHLL